MIDPTGEALAPFEPGLASSGSDARLADRLSHALAASGVSMRQLYRDTGIPYRSIQNYLGGRGTTIPASFVAAVARATGFSAGYLLLGELVEQGLRPRDLAEKIVFLAVQDDDESYVRDKWLPEINAAEALIAGAMAVSFGWRER